MLIAFTYLPGFVTMVFRGMPTVWRGRHRLIFCWLIFIQAVHPGRKTLEEMAKLRISRQRLVRDGPALLPGLLPPPAAPGALPRPRPAPAVGPLWLVSAHSELSARPAAAAGAAAR